MYWASSWILEFHKCLINHQADKDKKESHRKFDDSPFCLCRRAPTPVGPPKVGMQGLIAESLNFSSACSGVLVQSRLQQCFAAQSQSCILLPDGRLQHVCPG